MKEISTFTSIKRFTFRQNLKHLWGKLRRSSYTLLFHGYVKRQHERRRGACNNCGACCMMFHICPWLEMKSGKSRCTIYTRYGESCKIFPVDERDLRDRDMVMPDKKCGFYFISKEEARAARKAKKNKQKLKRRRDPEFVGAGVDSELDSNYKF